MKHQQDSRSERGTPSAGDVARRAYELFEARGGQPGHDLDNWLDPALFRRLPLPYSAGWRAAEAYVAYRRTGGTKSSPLPDFYIGAQAEIESLTLVTRDAARYRTYFPTVSLIAPP